MNYQWNIWNWIQEVFGTFRMRRSERNVRWMWSLLTPVRILHQNLLRFRADMLYEAGHSGQVIMLERLLNDIFVPGITQANGLIRISDPDAGLASVNTFLEAENQTAVPMFLESELGGSNAATESYLESEYSNEDVDFIVHLPSGLSASDRMRALLNRYKLAGKRYEIRPYTPPIN